MREGFAKYNCPVPPQLTEEIKQAESEILKDADGVRFTVY